MQLNLAHLHWYESRSSDSSLMFSVKITSGKFHAWGPLSWQFNINLSMEYIHYKVWDKITYQFPNFTSATIEVWEWISNVISHLSGRMIIYPCWDLS